MILHANDFPDGMPSRADVCIIGTGAAGLFLALELMGSGMKIVMLEAGELSSTDLGRSLLDGEIAGNPFRGLTEGRARQFGGTTSLWGGQCVAMDPMDFEARSWVPLSGWPFGPDELTPFYDRARQRLGLAETDFAPDLWRRFHLDSFDFDPSELRAAHGVFIKRPKLGGRYRRTLEAARDIRVVLGATATKIEVNPYATQVTGVTFRTAGRQYGTVEARNVVLCMGGIENARLLLVSTDVMPTGLGNARGLVGRYLNDHPCGLTAEIHSNNPRRLQDHFNMLYGRSAFYLPKMALSEAAQRREQTLSCVGRLVYDFGPASGMKALRDIVVDVHLRRWPQDLTAKLLRVARSAPLAVPSAWRLLRHGLSPAPRPHKIWLETFSEQTPDPESRVMLSDRLDEFGVRRVKINWRLDSLTAHTFRAFTNSVGREFRRLGLGVVKPAEWLLESTPAPPDVLDSYHPSGTTRMAVTPSRGVVDDQCQVFGVDGLFVAGSSVFPASGVANPTYTIASLAIRLADRIKRRFHEHPADETLSVRPQLKQTVEAS